MQVIADSVVYSASDLVGFLECTHLSNLERAALEGHLKRPMRQDPVLDRIAQRGIEHEQRFLWDLLGRGLAPVEIESDKDTPFPNRLARGRDETERTMRKGAQVIYQAVLFDGRRLGFADFLRRVDEPSGLGAWSYEVWDTKLARHAKASAVLQLCMYSDLVAAIQGRSPEHMHLALGGVQRETVSFRFADYAAYYRSVAGQFEALLRTASWPLATAPERVEHCEICRWEMECKDHWRTTDDLILVAGIFSHQRRELIQEGIGTRTALAEPAGPLPVRKNAAAREALARVHAQASIQVRGERQASVISELVPPAKDKVGALVPGCGLLMLPAPSPGDLFFDIEGDPFFGTPEVDGIDYLFGVIEPGRPGGDGQAAFHAFWSIEDGTVTPAAERRAFEYFIDLVMDRLKGDPDLHIYHYAPYEPTAVKRLAGRHGTREAEVDYLLRGHVFVDLYRATRQGIRASVESYSIKKLEPLYDFNRSVDLRDAGASIVEFETWLELGQGQEGADLLDQIQGYNRDDCVSAWRLRDWLETQRAALEAELGEVLPRPGTVAEEEREDTEAQKAVQVLVDQLLDGIPPEEHNASNSRWLLAQLLNWHRREDKSFWWHHYYLMGLTDQERVEDPDAIGMLTYVESRPDEKPRGRSTIHRYRFPPQEHKIRIGSEAWDPATDQSAGTVWHLDELEGIIDLRFANERPRPASLIPFDYVRPAPKPESLQRLAQWVIANGVDGPGEFRAARELLMRRPPKARDLSGKPADAARRAVLALDNSYLAIQGPPGSGKSTIGAQMIVDVVEAGKKVGVTANSHKVIDELLDKVAKEAANRHVELKMGHKGDQDAVNAQDTNHLKSNEAARDGLADGSLHVVGGTTWLWARDDMTSSVDYLFVDEAGQMSLADAIAASQCAENHVLLGDPQQLDQPLQGVHPPGADRSALAHLIGDAQVMPKELGLFLDGTWRLHPSIAAYTSEVFYDSRLHSHPGREQLALTGTAPLSGTGIRFVPVAHVGNSSDSPEEVGAIAGYVRELLASRAVWTDPEGVARPFTEKDVLIITPYNAQVAALTKELPGFRIDTVDKFQGQEAPVSIYSMATSSAEEAPRGLEFLYSLNRLNVATSRAQCLAVVVASPALLKVRCRTPRQMQLVNALARFVEIAANADDWPHIDDARN